MSTILTNPRKRKSYARKLRALFGPSIIAYWPLDEAGGTLALDLSGNGLHASHKGAVTPATIH